MKTNEMEGAALDWAVAECSGPSMMAFFTRNEYTPSTDWEQGGPIIEREKISTSTDERGGWMAWIYDGLEMCYLEHGPNPLIAAMRCYVASKLGEEVEIPEGLQ